MRDPRRPPAHPLVELVYDVRDALNQAASDERGVPAPAQICQRLQVALRSARRLLDALEQLVDELAAESLCVVDDRAMEKGASDVEFQKIRVR